MLTFVHTQKHAHLRMNVHTHKYIYRHHKHRDTYIHETFYLQLLIYESEGKKNELMVYGMLGYGDVLEVPHLCIVYCERVMFAYGSVVKVP